MREKKFRDDLYYRISTIPLVVPSLKDRVEDITLLARRLLRQFATDLGRGELRLSDDAERALQTYPWPGNVRELRNVLERAVLLSDHTILASKDLRLNGLAQASAGPVGTGMTLSQLERWYITKVLEEERGQVIQAAHRLGVPRSSLYKKIKQYGIG